MSVKRTILKGTLILTITGFATRFMGFFYRIFLSHTFGEEGAWVAHTSPTRASAFDLSFEVVVIHFKNKITKFSRTIVSYSML